MNEKKKKYYLIYQITNKLNGKIYIGKHITNNINDGYMGSGKYIRQAIQQNGIENFEKTILFECNSEDEMNQKEAEIVNEDFIVRDDVYNVIPGGAGGWSYNNNILKNNGAKNFFKNKTEEEIKEIRKKARECALKVVQSKEYSEKTSKRLKEYFKTHEPHFLGWHHSEEVKHLLSEKNRGRFIGKLNGNYGRHWWKDPNDKTKSKMIKEGDSVPEGWVRGHW